MLRRNNYDVIGSRDVIRLPLRDRAIYVAPYMGFLRSSNLLVSLNYTSNQPLLPWQRKF